MKRSITLLLVLVSSLVACGGGGAAPAAPATDVASSAAPAASDAPAAAASAAPSAEPSAAASAASSAAPKTTMSVAPGSSPSAAPADPAPGGEGAPPPLSKTQKGILHQQLAGTEMVFITVTDAGATCASAAKPAAKGDRRVEIRAPWKTGFYTITSRNSQVSFEQYQGKSWQKADAAGDGGVQVRAAPTAEGSTGRIHVQGKRQGDSIDAELEVLVCTAVDLTKKGKK